MSRLLPLFIVCCTASWLIADDRPNVLWFVVEDMSPDFSCYGEKLIETPNVDRLAREGVRFTNAHVTAPVCSTCRSAFMTGMHQASIGSHNHRMTGPPIKLPGNVIPLPELFQRAGYYTCNGDGLQKERGRVRKKTDYNFVYEPSMYDGVDWNGRKPGQPFFMQIQMAGGKLRGADETKFEKTIRNSRKLFGDTVDPSQVELPPYYPNDNVFQLDWAAYLESVRQTDHHVGVILQRLQNEGVLDSTLVIFMTDHGISHARGKQFNYREGTLIPFVVRGPVSGGQTAKAGEVREDFVEHIDMAAISLAAAGIDIPRSMQAKDVFAVDYQRQDIAFAARDRCDETIDFIRSARTKDYLYIRNYNPFRPHLQPSRYKDNKILLKRLRELRNAGSLNPRQMSLLFSPRRVGEELYDLKADPHEIENVVGDERYAQQLKAMRRRLDEHLSQTHDAGFLPEPVIAEISGGDETIYAYCRDETRYPIGQIVDLANVAISRDEGGIPKLRRELKSGNRVVRYWAASGLRNLESRAAPAKQDLQQALKDNDASVRITVAAALAKLGEKDSMLKFLLGEAKLAKDDAHALWALDAIKFLDSPDAIDGYSESDMVKGQYSGRAFDFLSKGGLVFGDGVTYWSSNGK